MMQNLTIDASHYDQLLTSVSDTPTDRFSIYPNPTSEMVTLDKRNTLITEYQVSLFDITGREVLNAYDISDDLYTIDLTDQVSGVYFICIRSGENELYQRLVVR